jgi:plastocyanin
MKILNILLILISILFLTGCTQVDTLSQAGEIVDFNSGESPLLDESVKEITIDAFSFGYSIPEIKIRKGQKIKITLTNSGGTHDFVIDELNIASDKIITGESTTFEFTSTDAGEFDFYCSVGNHRAQGMVGKLIVIE